MNPTHRIAKSPGATEAELHELAGQMSTADWDRLLVNPDFIEAACTSAVAAAKVAEKKAAKAEKKKRAAMSALSRKEAREHDRKVNL